MGLPYGGWGKEGSGEWTDGIHWSCYFYTWLLVYDRQVWLLAGKEAESLFLRGGKLVNIGICVGGRSCCRGVFIPFGVVSGLLKACSVS